MANQPAGKRPSKKLIFVVLILVFGIGVGFAGVFNVVLSHTNELEFCTSCHTMQIPLEEYKKSAHYKNASGVRAICSDCHVPKEFLPKMYAKIMATKDLYHQILGTIDTPELYEGYRWHMASSVWAKMRANNSRECRACHDFSHMDLSSQTRSARNRHSRAEDEGETCIDCHKGVAHEEPDEPEVDDEDKEEAES